MTPVWPRDEAACDVEGVEGDGGEGGGDGTGEVKGVERFLDDNIFGEIVFRWGVEGLEGLGSGEGICDLVELARWSGPS